MGETGHYHQCQLVCGVVCVALMNSHVLLDRRYQAGDIVRTVLSGERAWIGHIQLPQVVDQLVIMRPTRAVAHTIEQRGLGACSGGGGGSYDANFAEVFEQKRFQACKLDLHLHGGRLQRSDVDQKVQVLHAGVAPIVGWLEVLRLVINWCAVEVLKDITRSMHDSGTNTE